MRTALRTSLALALCALLAAPAAAEWYAYGSFEPDTPYDSPAFMWQEPPPPGAQRVYFNGFAMSPSATPAGKPGINPNVAMLHTQIEPFASERHVALLGVWVDCNGDGYIGLAETALREYSAQLLLSQGTCPATEGPTNEWPAGAHNYNGWVSEFIPIVSHVPTLNNDKRSYRDDAARVWADFHRPDEKPFQRLCRLTTFERGTMETVGGMINFFDCYYDLLGPWNGAMALIDDPLRLSFPNEDDARSNALGRTWLFGPESTDYAAVRTVDCSEAPILQRGSLAVRTPKPALGPSATNPTQFSFAGQYNQTNEEWTDDCDTSNDQGHDFYEAFETDINGVNPANKTQPNFVLLPEVVPRGAMPFLVVGAGSAGIPQEGGVSVGGTRWVADFGYLNKPGPGLARADLDGGAAEPAPAYWLTYYARVGDTTRARGVDIPGDGGTYGSWHCGSHTSGIRNGWNCDASVWWINPDGSFHPLKAIRPHVGWRFDLRDVDCHDGSVGELGIGVQPAYYGEGACP